MDLSKKKSNSLTDPEAKKINWFDDHDVYYIEPAKQREVTLNPGRDFEWFSKVYPVYGKVSFTKKVYINDLPRNCRGKIIAVTAVVSVPESRKAEVDRLRHTLPYPELSRRGILKPKPLGTYYELFESPGGSRIWTNPTEYDNVGDGKQNKRKNKRVSENPQSGGYRLSQIKDVVKDFRLKGANPPKDNFATGVKGKG
jgi:hypothetical protein